jgi:hypothetical protein
VTARAWFYDEEPARAVGERLEGAGFAAAVARERLAGEDDDEDHPWSVVSEAPTTLLEHLVEEYDGWLDVDPVDPSPPRPPLALPDAPRRVRGQVGDP